MIFEDTKIMKTENASEINKYPTVFLSFANAKGNKTNIVMQIKMQLLKEYIKFKQIFDEIDMFEKPSFDMIMKGLNNLQEWIIEYGSECNQFLNRKKLSVYGKRVMLFMDE